MKKEPFWQYKQISSEFIRKIESGDLKPDDKLPSEKEIGQEFDVSRITVRKALADLEENKYIIKKQGQGSFVRELNPNRNISFIDNNVQNLRQRGYSVNVELEEFKLLANGEEPEIRKIMQLEDINYLYRIKQVYVSDDNPIIKRETFMSFDAFPMLVASEFQNNEVIPLLTRKYNFDVSKLEHEFSTRVDDRKDKFQEMFNSSPRESYVIAKTTYSDNNHIVYLSTAVSPASSRVFFVKHKEEKSMGEPHILLTRIDNRLVHGQVGVTWTKTIGANLILVANDALSEDALQQKLMKSTADSSGAQIRFFTLQKTIDIIQKAADRQKIFIVVKTPEDALTLIEGGVPINEINVGNMHFSPGKEEVSKKVYVDQTDKEALMAAVNRGINVYIQDVPGDRKIQVNF